MNGIGNAKLVDSICSQLESSWQSGSRLTLLELLNGSASESSPDHAALVSMIQYEIELRRNHGESPQVAEYAASFPEITLEILEDLMMIPALPAFEKNEQLFPSRYQQMEMVGQGGIGRVWRVMDSHMDRTLAIKVSRQRSRDKRFVNLRLEREAKLTGALQHPGIPPIFDHGKLTDGSEYFSMKLVEGKTLDKILQERKSDRSDLPALIGIFEQISQTVAYAHSQDVIHRDLKPQNVMVGEFGEVQVMDWGMGKRLSDNQTQSAGKAIPTAIKPNSNSETLMSSNDSSYADRRFADPLISLTQTGEVFGTPAYMAPEQARGDIDSLGPQSDVFGLGAILFSILTGSRLYDDLAADEILLKAAAGDLKSSVNRLNSSESDSELVQLCKNCLEPNVKDRPTDGAVVAQRVTEYQDSVQRRLQQAELDQQAAEVRASEERKRRTTTMWLSGAILAAVTAGLLGALFFWNQSEKSKVLAEANAILADERFLTAKRTVDEYLTEVANSKTLLATPGNQQLRKTLLEKAKTYYTAFVSTRPDDPKMQEELAAAHCSLGRIATQLEPGLEPIEHYKIAIDICQRLLDDGNAKDSAGRRICRSYFYIAEILTNKLKYEEAIEWAEQGVGFAEALVLQNPDADHFLLLANLNQMIGSAQTQLGRHDVADKFLTKALESKKRLVEESPQDRSLQLAYANLLVDIGGLRLSQEEFAAAEQVIRKALEIQKNFDASARSFNVCSIMLTDAVQKDAEREIVLDELVNRLKEYCNEHPLMLHEHDFLAQARIRLSTMHQRIGDIEQSLSVHKELMQDLKIEIAKHPDSVSFLHRYVAACSLSNRIGNPVERREEILIHLKEAIKTTDRLIELRPKRELSFANSQLGFYTMIGMLNRKSRHIDQALIAYAEVHSRIKKLEERGLANDLTLLQKASTFNNIGYLFNKEGELESALASYQSAAELYGQLANNDHRNENYGFQGSTIGNIGSTLVHLGEFENSIEPLDLAIKMIKNFLKERPRRTWHYAYLTDALLNRADASFELGEREQGIKYLDEIETVLDSDFVDHGIKKLGLAIAGIRACRVQIHNGLIEKGLAVATEIAEGNGSDCQVSMAELYACAATETLGNDEVDAKEMEKQVADFAQLAADCLDSALDENSFQLLSPMTIPNRPLLKPIWDRPELANVVVRIEQLRQQN